MATTVAILGTGSIGMRHYRCFSGLKDVRVIAVPARPERVAELQAEGIDALPQIPNDAQAVVIATDTARHLADWQRFQDRFCLIEKPLTCDPTPELETLVAQTESRAFTACVLRFNKTLSEFKKRIDNLAEKPVQAFAVCQSYLPDWRPNRDYRTLYSAQPGQGGALRELIHEIDYAGWIFGWPQTISGKLTPANNIEIADEEVATAITNQIPPSVAFKLSLAESETERFCLAIYNGRMIRADLIAQEIIEVVEGVSTENIYALPEDRDAMYIRQAQAFVNAVQGQDSRPLATAAEGLKALQVCQAVRLSNQTGNPVNL